MRGHALQRAAEQLTLDLRLKLLAPVLALHRLHREPPPACVCRPGVDHDLLEL